MFKLDQDVAVTGAGAPGLTLFGKIVGGPTLIHGKDLAWPVELQKDHQQWCEGRKLFIRVLLVHQEGLKAI